VAVAVASLPGITKLFLLDGDIFEEKNLDRQLGVQVGKAKVDALKEFILERRPELEIETCPHFIGTLDGDSTVSDWLSDPKSPKAVVMTVDNYAGRRRILESFFSDSQWPGAQLLFAGGNELWDGHGLVQLKSWKGTPSEYTTLYPETLTRTDAFDPAKPSCTELAQASEPQLAVTNQLVADFIVQLIIFYEIKLNAELYTHCLKTQQPILPLEHACSFGTLTTRHVSIAGQPKEENT
jgi:hypothetical protein